MFEKIKSMLGGGRQKSFGGNYSGVVGGKIFNPFSGYWCGSYDNTFPSVSRIAEAIAEVMPYAVDINGEKLKEVPALVKAICNPNAQMSGPKFFEALATMMLVHPTVYLLCWRREGKTAVAGGPITKDNIAGFTFLENPDVRYVDGVVTYKTISSSYTDREVLALSLNINPYSITAGYSPSVSAKKWASIDDYIADYQAGFFRNGAIPEGQFVITAKDQDSFNETVDYLQKKHSGAGNNGRVNYVHRPTNEVGQTGPAQIEWVPYGTANKDLTLEPIFEQANKKLDMAFGVPQEVKGYLENSNYASAEVADYVFARRVVYPKLVKIWAEFTHEMNRVTGGLGFALSFDYEMPMLSDEIKVRAEAEQIRINTMNSLLAQGFSLESAVVALGLPQEYLKLEEKLDGTEAEVEDLVAEAEPSEVSQLETSTKALKESEKCHCKVKLPTADPNFERVVKEYMQAQIDAAIKQLDFNTPEEAKAFADRMWEELEPIIQKFGVAQKDVGYGMVMQEIGEEVEQTLYEISPEFKNSYKNYLNDVSLSYTNDTNESIRRVLEQADTEGWDEPRIRTALEGIMETDDWRVQRIARTETHRAEQMGQLDSMRQVQEETGVRFVKVWRVNPGTTNHCAVCEALDGTTIPLDRDFGEFAVGTDEAADAHPNCNCGLFYEIAPDQPAKIVKVTCPNCGRYMFESSGGNAKNVICANSKCKKHYNIKVKNGRIEAEEVKND